MSIRQFLTSLITSRWLLKPAREMPVFHKVIHELLDFMIGHFSLEEGLMRQHHYCALDLHINEHERLIAAIVNFRQGLEKARGLSCRETLSVLRSGQSAHIRCADKALVADLRRRDYEECLVNG